MDSSGRRLKTTRRQGFRLARITAPSSDDTKDMRLQQISFNDSVAEGVVHMPYGMSANIPKDSVCLFVQIGGDQGNLVILPDRTQDRVKDLADGEVAFFNPLTKTRSIYRANGDLEQVVNGDKLVTITGNHVINITGDVTQTIEGDVTQTITGNVIEEITGTTAITSIGAVTWTAPTITMVTNLILTGAFTQVGAMAVTGPILGTTLGETTTGKDFGTHVHVGSPTAPSGPVSNTGAIV